MDNPHRDDGNGYRINLPAGGKQRLPHSVALSPIVEVAAAYFAQTDGPPECIYFLHKRRYYIQSLHSSMLVGLSTRLPGIVCINLPHQPDRWVTVFQS